MTTEGEGDNVEKTVRTTRKRKTSFHVLKSSDDEHSDICDEQGSSEEDWRYSKKKTSQRKHKHRPMRTLKKSLAEKAKKLKSEFNDTICPVSPDIRGGASSDTNSDAPRPDTTTLESCKSPETEEKKPVLTFTCDMIEKVTTVAQTNEADNTRVLSPTDLRTTGDIPVKCDSSIKIELVDSKVNVKNETDDDVVEVESTIVKSLKPERDADTVILLSDDGDDDEEGNVVPDDANMVVLNCNILQTYASPILTGGENRDENTQTTINPLTPTIRVRPLEQISNPPPSLFDTTVSPAVSPSPAVSYNPRAISSPPSFAAPIGNSVPAAISPTFSSPGSTTSPRTRATRGTIRGARPSSRGRPPRPRSSPDVRCLTPRSRRPAYNYSPRSRVTTPPRLDSISFNNISPSGTVIRNGLDSITITPTKKSPERPAQRRLFRSEVEGVIAARETGYVVSLANGTFFPLSHVQVEKLREQNDGVLPTKLRIPVPSDVAASIETRIVLED